MYSLVDCHVFFFFPFLLPLSPTTDCIFEKNYAIFGGGAMTSGFPYVRTSGVSFISNRALSSGGGLLIFRVPQVDIIQGSTFIANVAIGNQWVMPWSWRVNECTHSRCTCSLFFRICFFLSHTHSDDNEKAVLAREKTDGNEIKNRWAKPKNRREEKKIERCSVLTSVSFFFVYLLGRSTSLSTCSKLTIMLRARGYS